MITNLQSAYEGLGCVPKDKPDPETGCRACGDNARADYEQCRQTYFLKQQNQILRSQQKEQDTKVLETKNQELQKQIEVLNKKITAVNSSTQIPKLEASISTYFLQSITKPDALNTALYLALFLFVVFYLIFKKRKKNTTL